MSNRANNIWAAAATGSPGTNIARQQQSRWTGVPNEAIKRLVEDKIGSMLEGISEATERQAAKQMQLFADPTPDKQRANEDEAVTNAAEQELHAQRYAIQAYLHRTHQPLELGV